MVVRQDPASRPEGETNHRISTSLGRVAVRVNGDGPPLFLVPANGHESRDFDAIVPVLARRNRTFALDWPGFGDSDAPENPFGMGAAKFCALVDEVTRRLDERPGVFLGNSVGGLACLRVAARRPSAVTALVLVDTTGFASMTAVARAFCWVQGRVWVRRSFGTQFASWYTRRRNPQVQALLDRVTASRSSTTAVAVEAALWRSFPSEADASDDADKIRCPTLLVWGRRDPIARVQVEGRRAQRLLGQARYAELDTGHVPFVEDPQAFLDAVVPFLEGEVASMTCDSSR